MGITRAEDLYRPPPYLAPDAWATEAPALRCVLWFEHRQQRRIHTGDAFVIGQQLYARINHGRWLADCTCGSAQVVTPADPRMWCVECGTGWWQLTFPADVVAVEESLSALPIPEQNWWAEPDPARPTLEV
jgi:hypothetical protein